MKTKSRCLTQRVVMILFVLFASLILFAGQGMAQKPDAQKQTKADAELEDALYICLRAKFPKVQRDPLDHANAYDLSTSRSFFYDKDKKAWRDAKTGECICPKCAPETTTTTTPPPQEPPSPPREPSAWEKRLSCLKARFPRLENEVSATFGGVGHDPDSNRDFRWNEDKKSWVDDKTGECICPKCTINQINSPTPKKPKIEVSVGYLFMHAPKEDVKNLNGFDVSLFYRIKTKISIGGEVGGGFGSTTGTIGTTTIDTSLKRFTYLFGPRFKVYENDKARVFVHSLFGGVHDKTNIKIGTSANSTSFSANAFAMEFGGGVDLRINDRFSFRAIQIGDTLTHFGNQFQNNVTVSSGMVYTFGKK